MAQPGRLRSTVGTAGVARGGLHGHAVDRWSSRGGEGAWTYGSHLRTYSGSCHCGRVRFEIDAELDHVRVCDCSFCSKRGALVHRVPPERFRMLSEWSELSLYEWNTKTAKHYFCKTCGVFPFHRPRTAPELWGINVRCLEGVDASAIPIKYVHGSRLS